MLLESNTSSLLGIHEYHFIPIGTYMLPSDDLRAISIPQLWSIIDFMAVLGGTSSLLWCSGHKCQD